MFKNLYILIFIFQSFFGQMLIGSVHNEQEISLENWKVLLDKLDKVDTRLRHGDNEIPGIQTEQGKRTFSYQEWASLKNSILIFKNKVEQVLGDSTNPVDLQETAWILYAGLYAKAMNLYAIIDPDDLENLNHQLGLKILNKNQKVPLQSASLNKLVNSEVHYRLIDKPFSQPTLIYNKKQIKNFIEINEPDYLVQTMNLDSEQRMEKMLFRVSQKIMIDHLEKGSAVTKSLLEAADPSKERDINQQKQEVEFRQAVFDKLDSSPGLKALLSPYSINLKWIREFLEIIFPNNEFETEIELDIQLRILAWIRKAHWKIVKEKWSLFPLPLVEQSVKELRETFCRLIEETRQQGWEQGIFKIAEANAFEYKEKIKELIGKTLKNAPSLSCRGFHEVFSYENIEEIKKELQEKKNKTFKDLLTSLTHLKRLDTDRDALLEEKVDIKSALKYFYIWIEAEIQQEHRMLSKQRRRNSLNFPNPKEPLRITKSWRDKYFLFSNSDNYTNLKEVFLHYQNSAWADSWQKLNGVLKEKMTEDAKMQQRILDKMRTFFRFDEEERVALKIKEIPNIKEEENLANFKFHWLREQKKQFPILSTTLPSKHLLHRHTIYSYALDNDDKTLWESLTSDVEKNRPLIIEALRQNIQKNQQMVEKTKNFTDISDLHSILKSSSSLNNILGNDLEMSSYYLDALEKLQKPSLAETTLIPLGQKYYHTGFMGLIAIHLVGVLLIGLKWPRIAAYFSEAFQTISPRGHLLFFTSAMGIIGAEMSHMGHSIYGIEEPEYEQIDHLYNSFSVGTPQDPLIDLEVYNRLADDLATRKTSFFLLLGMDTLLLGIPALFLAPPIRKRLANVILQVSTARNNKFAIKTNKAFSTMGMKRITWDKEIIEGVYAVRKKKIDSQIYRQGKLIEQKLQISGTGEKSPHIYAQMATTRSTDTDSNVWKLIEQYKKIYSNRKSLDQSYRFLIRKKTRMEKKWDRYALQHRFGLERLKLPIEKESFAQLGSAFEKAKIRFDSGEITAQEFAAIQESFSRTYNFLLQKFYYASQVESTKSLFLHSVVDVTKLSSYQKKLVSFQLNKNEFFEYTIIDLTSTKGEGGPASLIIPNIVNMKNVYLLNKGKTIP